MLKTILIVVVVADRRRSRFRRDQARHLPRRAHDEHQGAAGEDLRVHRRLPPWGAWSPYEKKDPAMKRTLSGAASGKGAVYEWDGDSNVGKGRMEITDSAPPLKDHDQAGFHQAVRRPQHRRVHARAQRRRHQRHLGDVRPRALHLEGHAGVRRHGQHGRQGLRSRSRQPEGARREVSAPTPENS